MSSQDPQDPRPPAEPADTAEVTGFGLGFSRPDDAADTADAGEMTETAAETVDDAAARAADAAANAADAAVETAEEAAETVAEAAETASVLASDAADELAERAADAADAIADQATEAADASQAAASDATGATAASGYSYQAPATPEAGFVPPVAAAASPSMPAPGTMPGQSAPQPGYGAPQTGYSAPQPGYQAPYVQQPYAQQPYGAPGYAPGYAQPPMSDPDQRMWSMFAHLGGVFVSWLCPLIIYLVCKDRGAYVRYQSSEALNFQLTLFIAYLVGALTSIIGIGVIILIAAWICSIVFAIMAAVATNRGDPYRYPICIRFIK